MKSYLGFTLLTMLILQSCHSHKAVTVAGSFFGEYSIHDEKTGTITEMKVDGDKRTLTSNSLPNHEVGAFPNPGNPNTIQAIEKTYTLPQNPKYLGKVQWVKETGVALNGIKFDPGTGEVVQCESGENYRIEAIQNIYDLGLDHNHAHVQPWGEYHYHGVPTGIVEANDKGEDLVHVGFALDGFAMYYSKSGAYTSSYKVIDETRDGTDCTYSNPKVNNDVEIKDSKADGTYLPDWEYVDGLGDLDECNGVQVNGQYVYMVTDEYPFVGRCLKGEFTEEKRKGPPPGGRGRGPGPGPGRK